MPGRWGPGKLVLQLTHPVLRSMQKPKSNAPVVSLVAMAKPSPKRKKKTKQVKSTWMTPYLGLSIDPVNASLQSAHRPDLNSTPTVIWRESDNVTFTTDAQGNLWLDMVPQLSQLLQTSVLSAANPPIVTTATWSNVVNYAELQTTFSSWRPYSLSVEMEYVGRQDEAKGVFGVCTTGSRAVATDSPSLLYDEYDYKEVSVQNGSVAAMLRIHDNEDFGSLTTAVDVNPSQAIHLVCLGLPASSACVRVRYTIVGEYAVGHNKIMSRSASHSYVRPSEIHAASNVVGPAATTAVGSEPYDKLVQYGKKAISIGASLNNLYQDNKQAIALGLEFLSMI